jgi:Fe-S cluster assembly protein SufD
VFPVEPLPEGWEFEVELTDSAAYLDQYRHDFFSLLNGAATPGRLVGRASGRTSHESRVVLVHEAREGLSLPATRIEVSGGASLTVCELHVGGAGLVAPLGEYIVGDNSSLRLATLQDLDRETWYVARTTTQLHRDARMHHSVVGMGAHYDRSRNDAEFLATGAHNELHSAYLGSGEQVHDYRTHQRHLVGRTSSNLIAKGAVGDHSRAVYTGLIEIARGARRSDARQSNYNLLLSPHAHADTVPNLDIQENDVTCAHASSVGPLDELQLWYLTSRGVSRSDAERLIVSGFFAELTDDLPASVETYVGRAVSRDLATMVGAVS